jgi:hypothetical protein
VQIIESAYKVLVEDPESPLKMELEVIRKI